MYELWERVLNRYEKIFDGNVQDNYSASQNGLIYDILIFSCLTMIENMKEGRLEILEILIISIKYLFLRKLIFQHF